jgi:uncharacterized delta-60 repeat protein
VVSIELNNDPMIISESGAMCLDSQNRIVYGCYFESLYGNDFAVYRFLEDGSPDNSFGDYGLSVTDIEGDQDIYAITCQYDDKIIAGGAGGGDFVMVRYLENGDPDPAFGPSGNGIVISEAGSFIGSLNLQADGLLVAAGTEFNGTGGSSDFVATRFFSGLNVRIETPIPSETSLKIYPNPAQDQININIPSGEERQEINIYNTAGVRILHQDGKSSNIDISSLPPGIHILEVRFLNSAARTKLFKE